MLPLPDTDLAVFIKALLTDAGDHSLSFSAFIDESATATDPAAEGEAIDVPFINWLF